MKKKILFQKVMGITVTAILTGSTCASPILANDVVIEETEFQSVDEEDTSDGSENLNFEDMTGQDAGVSNKVNEDLFSDGSGENFSSELTAGSTETASGEEASEYSCAAPQKKLMLAQIDKEQAEKSEEMPELNGINQLMYTAIKNMSENIKAGRDNVTTAMVTVAEAGYENVSYSAEELGVDGILDGETISQEAADAAYSMAGYDPELVLRAIRQAEPDGLSWAEGTIECDTAFPLHTVFENGEYRLGFSDKIQMHFQVKEDFAGTEPYTVDLSKMTPQQSENSSNDAEEDTSEVFVQEISAEGITIKTQPKDVVTKKGETVEFSVVAEGTGLTYQWQYRTSATASWKNFASATKPSIKKVTGDWDGWQVKCVIKDKAGNSQDSNIAKISFGGEQKEPIVIKTQPKNVTTQKGEMVEFSVEAEGTGLTYQWQYRTDAAAKWRNFSSATTAAIRKLTGDWDGWEVKCVIRDKAGNSLDSNIAKISFGGEQKEPIVIKTQPKDVVTEKGETVEFAIEAEGTGLTYQWKYRTGNTGSWKNFASATKPSIQKVTGDWDGWQVKCTIKDKAGNSLDSDIANIMFKEGLLITKQPQDVETEKGATVEFSVEAEGTGLTYQWQYRTGSTGNWRNFASATKSSIQKVTGDWDGWQVRCLVKDRSGQSMLTRIATIKFAEKKLEITEQPTNVKVQTGETAKFSVKVNKEKATYQWETRGAYQSKFVSVKDATGSSYSVKADAKNNGQVFRCVITDSDGNTVTSEEAVLNIQYQNHTATFVNASTNEIITTAEAEKFESIAGLPAGNIIHLPKDVTEKTSKPYSYYTVKNGEQIPVNLEAVVEGSSASYADLELFFYVTDDVVVYVNV